MPSLQRFSYEPGPQHPPLSEETQAALQVVCKMRQLQSVTVAPQQDEFQNVCGIAHAVGGVSGFLEPGRSDASMVHGSTLDNINAAGKDFLPSSSGVTPLPAPLSFEKAVPLGPRVVGSQESAFQTPVSQAVVGSSLRS